MTKISCTEVCTLILLTIATSCATAEDKKNTGTLKDMVAGDHACYVDFIDQRSTNVLVKNMKQQKQK